MTNDVPDRRTRYAPDSLKPRGSPVAWSPGEPWLRTTSGVVPMTMADNRRDYQHSQRENAPRGGAPEEENQS